MEKPKAILFEYLDKHEISYDTHYIDDSDVAFDAIEEAMEAYAKLYHSEQVNSVDLVDFGNRYSIEDIEKCVENWGICKVEKEYIEQFLNRC